MVLILGACQHEMEKNIDYQLNCNDSTAVNQIPGSSANSDCIYFHPEQKILLTYFTSANCPKCGKAGNKLFKKLMGEDKRIVPLAVHYGFKDPLQIKEADSFFYNFLPYSAPFFIFNNRALNDKEFSEDSILKKASQVLNALQKSSVAAVATVFSINGDSLTCYYGTRFFDDTSGKFYLACYLAEDKVLKKQNGVFGKIKHHNVLRETITSPFGEEVIQGKINSGFTYKNVKKIHLKQEYRKQNLIVIAVLFCKKGKRYQVINSALYKIKH